MNQYFLCVYVWYILVHVCMGTHVYAGACPQVCTSMYQKTIMCSSGAVNHFCVSQAPSLLSRLGWLESEPRDLSDTFSQQGVHM